MSGTISIRFYEELNDFLPERKRKQRFTHEFVNRPSVKDVIESLGVPHVEVDLVLVNGESVDFTYHPENGDHIAVYPVFESLNIQPIHRLRAKPLRQTKFVLDVHLGKLANYLRLCGFDTHYENDLDDHEIVEISKIQKRIVLTRDVGLLKHNNLTHGLWIRSQESRKQLKQVISRLDLAGEVKPFRRCMHCNGILVQVDKEKILHRLKPKTREYFDEFFQCRDCEKIYWRGSHYEKMLDWLEEIRREMAE